jgi:hypothetical protein
MSTGTVCKSCHLSRWDIRSEPLGFGRTLEFLEVLQAATGSATALRDLLEATYTAVSPSRPAYLHCAEACTLDGAHVTRQVLQVLLVTCRQPRHRQHGGVSAGMQLAKINV